MVIFCKPISCSTSTSHIIGNMIFQKKKLSKQTTFVRDFLMERSKLKKRFNLLLAFHLFDTFINARWKDKGPTYTKRYIQNIFQQRCYLILNYILLITNSVETNLASTIHQKIRQERASKKSLSHWRQTFRSRYT